MLALGQFWDKHYKSYLERKKYSTESQYKSLWKCWIETMLGKVHLFEMRPDQVEAAMRRAREAKKSSDTAKHIRKVVSAMFEYARRLGMFTGENPARLVELGENIPVRRGRSLTVEQCRVWFSAAKDKPANPRDRRSDIKPVRTMSLLETCCSVGTSEQLGLLWCHLNLTERAVLLDQENLEPFSAAIREQSYHGRRGTLKHGHRRRIVPLPAILVEQLKALRADAKWSGPYDPVFAGASGKPIWADNLQKRGVKRLAAELGMPWRSWNVFRHTCGTLTKTFRMLDVDRKALMGHSDAIMTDRYTHEDFERMRAVIEQIASAVTMPIIDPGNVIQIRRKPAKSGNSDSQSTATGAQRVESAKGAAS
jgi:integrase